MKLYNTKGIPGCAYEHNNIRVSNCAQAGFNTKATWIVVCLNHNTCVLASSLERAKHRANNQSKWCVQCSNPDFKIHDFVITNDVQAWGKITRKVWVATCRVCHRANKYLGEKDLDSFTMANNMLYTFKVECNHE